MTVFILGPSKWRSGYRPTLPAWIGQELPPGWRPRGKAALAPLDLRAALAENLRSHGRPAILMEEHAKRAGETNTGLFRRLVHEQRTAQYFVYWPYNAQRPGVDWELGILASWLDEGKDIDVRVFVESTAGGVKGGAFESFEQGARTTYYEDLLAYGCPIVPWDAYDELFESMVHHSA